MLIVDTHLHLYPWHDRRVALDQLSRRLIALGGADAVCVGCLAERHDCDAYGALVRAAAGGPVDGYRVEPAATHLRLVRDDGAVLYLLPGRQIVTAERLEILALATRQEFADGESAPATVSRVLAAGGLPVLAWAPGKWMFNRRPVVESVIRRFAGAGLVLGDSSLRPVGWPLPRLMRLGCRLGCGVVAGSDPLPPPGEEAQCGCYASCLRAGGREEDLAACVIAACRMATMADVAGRRGHWPGTLVRLYRNARRRGPQADGSVVGACV